MELTKRKAGLYSRLCRKKVRDEEGLFLAEGEKCVREMLSVFEPEAIIVSEEYYQLNNPTDFVSDNLIFTAGKEMINKISSFVTPSEIIGVFHKLPNNPIEDKLDPGQLYLVLDEIQDPGNLGTIIRSADWFGVKDIYGKKACPA